VKNSKIIIIRQVGNKVNKTKREKDKEMGKRSIEASHDDNKNRKNQSDVFKYRIDILFVNSML
jgi:hypothetical protein